MEREFNRRYEGLLPAAGKGSRFREITEKYGKPKPLVQVGGKELIRHSLDYMTPDVVEGTVIVVNPNSKQIEEWAWSQTDLPPNIRFAPQTEPDLFGAITSGMNALKEEEFVASNADEVKTNMDMEKLLAFHERSGTLATMVLTYGNNLSRHRKIEEISKNGIITKTTFKPQEFKEKPESIGLISAGLFVINRRAEELFDPNHSREWNGIIDPLVDAGQLSAFVVPEMAYFNVGTPDELKDARAFFAAQSMPMQVSKKTNVTI